MKNIKNIIFDYGNVIFDIDFELAIQAFKKLGLKDIDALYGHKAQSALFDMLDKGTLPEEDFVKEIQKLTPNASYNEIIDAWNALLIGIEKGNLELLLKAKTRYRTFLLSNNNVIHYAWIIDYLKREWNIEDMSAYFEKDYYSHFMGMRKPDAEIFEIVLNEQKLVPEETLFIDDSPQHIETAKRLGLQTRLVLPGERLPQVLNDLL